MILGLRAGPGKTSGSGDGVIRFARHAAEGVAVAAAEGRGVGEAEGGLGPAVARSAAGTRRRQSAQSPVMAGERRPEVGGDGSDRRGPLGSGRVARARAAVTERERAARVEERAGQIGPEGERKRGSPSTPLFPFFCKFI